jgi:hypothetical protein
MSEEIEMKQKLIEYNKQLSELAEILVDQMDFDVKIREKLKTLLKYESSGYTMPIATDLPPGNDPVAKQKRNITSIVINKFFENK